jgi:hypothetical protein
MLAALFYLCLVLTLVTGIWALVIIFRRSIIGGLLSLFFGLPMLYFLVTGWGKEGEDIRTPFFLMFVLWAIAIAVGAKFYSNRVEEERQLELSAPAQSTPRFREPAPATESTRIRDTPAAPPAAAPQFPVQRAETVKEAPRRPKAAQSNCVYKPVMTDEDLAKCR